MHVQWHARKGFALYGRGWNELSPSVYIGCNTTSVMIYDYLAIFFLRVLAVAILVICMRPNVTVLSKYRNLNCISMANN